MASCFANVKDHDMAQFSFQPLRWYYRMSQWLMMESPFGERNNDGIHIIPKILYELVQFIYPSVLHVG